MTVAALAAGALAQIDIGRTMVTVNGTPIKAQMYYQRMEVLPNVGQIVGGTIVPGTPGFLTLQKLINEELMIQLASKEGVAPTDAEVKAELARRKQESPELYQAFKDLGLSDAMFERDILINMAEFRVRTKGINVTDFEVEKHYQDHLKLRYTLPKRYELSVIAVNTDEGRQKVDQEIAAGTDFAEIARKHSVDVTKASGGKFGTVNLGDLNMQLRTLFADAQPGEVVPWVAGGNGVQTRFRVDAVFEEKVLPLDDTLKRQIREKLMTDRGLALNNLSVKMEQMRKEANIEYAGTPFDGKLKEMFGGS